ncbi:hypothetical protein PilKf_02283 [Pillotina sp. SPG140]
MEDQLALYNLEGDQGIGRTTITMRDGFFFIADSTGNKIVRYNSYGDILSMVYNSTTNPTPLTFKEKADDERAMRWAFSYPLEEPGYISVDSQRHIYVANRVPAQYSTIDPATGSILNQVIVHFDSEGQCIGYLGQEGLGGTPFPYIEDIAISVHDEIVVLCRTIPAWNVYWFSADGRLLWSFDILVDDLPVPSGKTNVFSSLNSLTVAPDSRTLYVLIDYYRVTYDESTNTRTGIIADSAYLWRMDVEQTVYTESFAIPFYEKNGQTQGEQLFYSLLGGVRGGRVFLSVPEETGYVLLILDERNDSQRRAFIPVLNSELRYHNFDLSEDGILSALLADEWNVSVVWWRTDNIVGERTR